MNTTVVWLRDDLRLADNPALHSACVHGGPVVVVYIFDESAEIRPLGGASVWWLHHSLRALDAALDRIGGQLVLRRGPAREAIKTVVLETGAERLVWNRRYGLPERTLDADVKQWAGSNGIRAESFQANLLFEPWTIQTGKSGPYQVFTPFWKACLAAAEPRTPLPAPAHITSLPLSSTGVASEKLDSWRLLPARVDWAEGLRREWTPGEAGGQQRLQEFMDQRVDGYAQGRERPAQESTSRLSPHLRFGEVSPFQVWQAARKSRLPTADRDLTVFGAEIGWREFCWHLLYFTPDLATKNYRRKFDGFEWETDAEEDIRAWQQGRTGYPLVDAGMRQLWATGWMHNRIRMVTASFLTKNLLVDWRRGEQWFWDTLVDADGANNPANWQWVAGSGADASPYFRIFNPTTQSKKFDPDGTYLRRFVPELEELDSRSIHEPWDQLLGSDYPRPVVELGASRQRALQAYAEIKDAQL